MSTRIVGRMCMRLREWVSKVEETECNVLLAEGKVSERLHNREQHYSVKVYMLNVTCMVVIVAAVVGGGYKLGQDRNLV